MKKGDSFICNNGICTGSMDPYPRAPRSPRGKKFPTNPTEGSGTEDGCRSPINDQVSV